MVDLADLAPVPAGTPYALTLATAISDALADEQTVVDAAAAAAAARIAAEDLATGAELAAAQASNTGTFETFAGAQAKADAAAADALASISPTAGLGVTVETAGRVGVNYSTTFGITSAGVAYYDPDGASLGEESVLVADPASASGLSLVKIGA